MVELVKFVAQRLVDKPDAVDVREVDGPESVVIELRVDPDDMGKVIGKQGQVDPHRCEGGDAEERKARVCRDYLNTKAQKPPGGGGFFMPFLHLCGKRAGFRFYGNKAGVVSV